MEKLKFHYEKYNKDYTLLVRCANLQNQTLSGLDLNKLDSKDLKDLERGCEVSKDMEQKAFRTFKVEHMRNLKTYN